MLKPKISASMMCADLLHLERDVKELEKAQIEYLHFDIMDGVFVPNLMLNNEMMKAVRRATSIPFDVHLMIVNPETKIELFDLREGDIVSVHYESTPHVQRALQRVKASGAKAAVALNPATPVESVKYLLADVDMVLLMTVNPGFAGQKLIPQTLQKIADMRKFLDDAGYPGISLQVDGNCSFENIPKMLAMGADNFVVGSSSVFATNSTITDAALKLRDTFKKAVK